MSSERRLSWCMMLVALGLCFLLVRVASVADTAQRSAHHENVATNATYECVVAPNYWGWKNPQHGDHGQLADGRVVDTWGTDQGPIYTLPSSMGWMTDTPIVIFDLGDVRSIGGVGLHSVNSPWGPWWPSAMAVLVSDDNEHFYLAAEIDEVTSEQLTPRLSPRAMQAGIDRKLAEQGYEPTTHWLRTPAFAAHGRYVAVVMTRPPDTGAIVLDEMEIYAGDVSAVQPPREGPAFTEGRAGGKSYQLYKAINERISRDIAESEKRIKQGDVSTTARETLLADVAELKSKLREQPVAPVASFYAVLPVNDLHRKVFGIQAALWRAQGASPLRAWKTHRWDPLAPFEEPTDGEPRLQITMAQNAVRSDVLNLSNSTDRPLGVELTLTNLPDESLDLFEVPLVDTQIFEPVASALVPLEPNDGTHQITIRSGMTRQVWLRCSSRAIEPGLHQGRIRVAYEAEAPQTIDVPVEIKVVNVTLPDSLTLYLGGWDYPLPGTYQVTEQNLDPYVAMLKEYGVNVTWGSGYMGMGEYDASGNLVTGPSRQEVEHWLTCRPNAELYCVVAGALYGRSEQEVIAWARDWSSYMSSRGVSPDRVAILIRDEPGSAEELEKILRAGRAVKQGEPSFKIFNDIHIADPTQAPPVLDPLMQQACDIQCFNVGHYLDDPRANDIFMRKHERSTLQWWCYTGGQADRTSDPYVAWLLRSWFCFDRGLSGAHWWSFGDGNGGFSWNEYFNSGPTRSPLYINEDSIVTGKSMEAMREGAQDYELLLMLNRELEAGRVESAAARPIVTRDVGRVLKAHRKESWSWNVPKDRSIADLVRTKVLDLLDHSPASAPRTPSR